GRRVDRKPNTAVLFTGVDHCKADPGARDRPALNDFSARVATKNRQAVQVPSALAYRTHLAEICDNAGEHDLTADKIFDRVRCKLLASAQCEAAGHCFERHTLQRVDPRIADGLFAAQQNCLVHKIRRNTARRTARAPRAQLAPSTRFAPTRLDATVGPPSPKHRVIPCSASFSRIWFRSSRPLSSSTRKTLQPFC